MAEVTYDRHYRASEAACGPPFPGYVAFATAHGGPGVTVLDLGCGQGRDALVFGAAGCTVLGVDASSVGIAQLNAAASAKGLDVRGVVADLRAWRPARGCDVVLLDRVLHMLPAGAVRQAVLEMAMDATRPGGWMLLADEPRNLPDMRATLEAAGWSFDKDTKNRLFAQRPA